MSRGRSTSLVAHRRGALTKYDPDKGLKTIAVAEVAEKHYARAKDATGLQHAIRAKLTAQAEFVEWWDTQVEKLRGRPTRKSLSDPKAFRAGKNGLPDNVTLSRWRQKLGPEHFEETYETAAAKYRAILELEKGVHVGHATGEFEWYSPAEYVEAARVVLGAIDLDPASSEAANAVVKARHYFTRSDDALAREEPWTGRVWMNPPYAVGVVDAFAARLARDYAAGAITAAVVLVNNATETEWFQGLAAVASAISFPKGRLKYWRPGAAVDSVPLQGQAVIYCGDQIDAFAERFAAFGFVAGLRGPQ